MRVDNLNVLFGSTDFKLGGSERTRFYLSPGVGVARNGSRSMTFISPTGSFSGPIAAGTAVTFNLGAGIKFSPARRVGLRFDLRDYVSGGGTGNLNFTDRVCIAIFPPPPECSLIKAEQFFKKIPVQNNIVFSFGLIFRLR